MSLFAALLLLFLQASIHSFISSAPAPAPVKASITALDTVCLPTLFYGFPVDDLHILEKRVKRNQRFTDLLQGYYVSPKIWQQIHLLPKKIFDFRRVAAYKKYILITYPDAARTLKAMIYLPNAIDYTVFHLQDTLIIEKCRRDVLWVERTVSGTIQDNLYETISEMKLSHQLTNRLVDIFAWQIDFQHLQKGDMFKIIYEEQIVDDVAVGIGKIKGIYFDHSGTGYCAFPFRQDNKIRYFDSQGNSLWKSLLRYPIEFTRISSRYSRRRFHPIAKVFRPHLGTDFAAAAGTPIRAVGDGVVVAARYSMYNGNYVKIRHNDTYTTQYLHMSRISSGIKKGVEVSRGQLIGFVGQTGLATGPHLCYRFWKNNVQVDALKVKLPSAKPIQEAYRPVFMDSCREIITHLDSIPVNIH